ncbi:hypothetical protein DTO027I6_1345 [Penicillium roqueforti]|nr:hypothetical protein CBS147318_2092 [Penicillium roqueforti]KAI3170495.1 hypothetical protein DTO039G3_4724 [Penicillium roqueforti]KAI3220077.1 hypothetical protein DTO027I6_1345 [Penicillium roqueforti]
MDPFSRLPWFALQNVLSALPDLPSLHRLHNASTEVATFLHQNNDLFARIVDAIIENTAHERSLFPVVQRDVRQLVIIWAEQSRRRQQQPTEQNEQQETAGNPSVLDNLRYLARHGFGRLTPNLGSISPSTPAAVLCRLLALMSRLRCLVHASFHALVAKSLQLRIEHLPKKTLYINTRRLGPSHRPQGIPYTPVDVGPMMWVEEQRLLESFFCIAIFYELRKMYANFSVVSMRSETFQISSHDTVEDFWKKVFQGEKGGQLEQIATTLSWLDGQAGRRENVYSWLASGPVSTEYLSYYPCYTPLNDEQWEDEKTYIHDYHSSHGAMSLSAARCSLTSPLRCVDYAAFRPYGLIFWSATRMDALGFRLVFGIGHHMWFALSFVLTDKDWEDLVARQLDRSFNPITM